ncbi:MAG: LptF/LptG family permease, partial [Spirochaetales bacterium]|nr:LptF/LptG family permease [Spirochaetales bacterium]
MRSESGSRRLLYLYVGREYILSFVVAFRFFFFIFFVNQILVLAQRILLKSVRVSDVLLLVVFSIPQFLMYTMPFSSLASASMVIGNLSSQNEILAIRSSGIHIRHVFLPIIAISLVLSFATLMIADRMIPYTTQRYKEKYSEVLKSVPTLELKSYSSTRFGKRVISNGAVEGNIIHDVLVFDDTDSKESRVISATSGSIELLDINRYLY